MSTVKDAYQHLVNTLNIVFPSVDGWYRLSDPNDTEENFSAFLSKGWCLLIESGENTNRKLSEIHTFRRTYNVQVSVQVYGNERDSDIYDESVKTLLEASESLQLSIIKDQSLGSDNSGIVARIIGDTGFLPLESPDGKSKFITTSITIDVELFYLKGE